MDDLKLLGLHRAEFKAAERSQGIARKLQLIVIAVSILVIALHTELLSYFGAFINFLLAILWQVFAYKERRSHFIAERGRRAFLLATGLGLCISGKLYSDLVLQFTVSEAEAKTYEDPEYFKAYGPSGYLRLAMMLEESAFWTKHLYDKSAFRYWSLFLMGLITAVAGLLLLPALTHGPSSLLVTQMFCLLLAWFITGDIFSAALGYSLAARAVDDVENRLSWIPSSKSLDKDLLVILGDYNAIVQDAPTIPTSIYLKNREKLNLLWSERNRQSNG